MTIKVLLKEGVLIIDDEDAWVLEHFRWHPVRSTETLVYARTKPGKGQPTIALHRLLLNAPPDLQVDHVNGNGLDNRRENIRLATPTQNGGNRHDRSANPYRGVTLLPSGSWAAQITGGKGASNKALGTYYTPEQAALAYADAAEERYGEFANHDREKALAAIVEKYGGDVPTDPRKTHCVNGHALTPENIYWRSGPHRKRPSCLTCRDEAARRAYEKKKAS